MQLKGLKKLWENDAMNDDYVVERVDWQGSGGEAARAIRFDVFVREQGVPPDEELDATDPVASHFLAFDPDRKPCGTARLFPDTEDASLAHIGRMAVLLQARAKGCGRALMSALMAEALAGEADFFSIGTNDLIQYTLAAERGNPGVEDIYSPYHPAVLRLIAMTAKAAAKAGIVCGMCGEMAADLKLLPALWGMGVRELSMSAKAMTAARETLSQWSDGDCEELARAVLSCGSEEELRKVCGAAAVLSS